MRLIVVTTLFALVVITSNCWAEEKIFLGDLKPMKTKVGFPSELVIRNGKSPGTDLEFYANGKLGQKGLLAHPDSEIVYAIPSGAKKFTAVGTMPNFKEVKKSELINGQEMLHGSWSYEVYVDGVQVFESEPLCAYANRQIPINVEIPSNAKQLTLKTHALGNIHADHSIWAEPYFIKP